MPYAIPTHICYLAVGLFAWVRFAPVPMPARLARQEKIGTNSYRRRHSYPSLKIRPHYTHQKQVNIHLNNRDEKLTFTLKTNAFFQCYCYKPSIMAKYIFFVFIGFYALSSCTSDSMATLAPLPLSVGNPNEIRIVCDQDNWDGPLGDSIRYTFQAPFLILPNPEPMFDLKHFTAEEIINNELRRNLRTYVLIADLSDTESATTNLIKQDLNGEKLRRAQEDSDYNTMIGKDKWAKGQMLVYLFGNNQDALFKNMREKFPTIARRINDFDQNLIQKSAYVYGESNLLNNKVKELMGIDMHIPSDYNLALEKSQPSILTQGKQITEDAVPGVDFLWMKRQTDKELSNIVVYSIPYTSKDQFKKQQIINLINKVGKEYISSTIEDSYLIVNDIDLPVFTTDLKINGRYAIEARGVWEMENDFMGGPFISYLIHNEKEGKLVLLNGFVYAPSQDKRNYMQEIATVLKNTEFQ